MWFFKKKKKQKYEYIDPMLDIEAEFRKRRENEHGDRSFADIEALQFVHTQCQVMTESSQYINELRKEHTDVRGHLSDIRIIEGLPDNKLTRIRVTAKEILKLKERTDELKKQPSKLSKKQHAMFARYAEDFPQALTNMQNDEKYEGVIKHDMRMLDAEKVSIKDDISDSRIRRKNIRNISIISFVAIMILCIAFFSTGQLNSQEGMTWFMVLLTLATLFVLVVFIMQRMAVYNIKLSEKKLNRAITLLNKTKIKYVNIYNSVEYQHEKYGVKNAYELGRIYEVYLEEKKRAERVRSSNVELEDAITRLAELLNSLALYDAAVWSKQLDVLMEPKLMKEMKRTLSQRAQKLMDNIEYNNVRIDEAKNAVMEFVKNHPHLSQEVMNIVDSYDN